MPNKYEYTGPAVILGRFGEVKKGDVLALSPREEAYIVAHDHPHLKPVDAKRSTRPAGPAVKIGIPPNIDTLPPEKQAEIRAAVEEQRRQEQLAKANNQTANIELSEQTREMLEDTVVSMRAEGIEVKVAKGAGKPALIAAINEARGRDSKA
jgi:hypothetical protein